jgi:hypothetical protein
VGTHAARCPSRGPVGGLSARAPRPGRRPGGEQRRGLADHFAPGRSRFDLAVVGARATSGAGLNSTQVVTGGQPPRVLEQEEDDRRFKPGLWKQDGAFLEGVRRGRQPPWPAASLSDAYQTTRLIDRISLGAAESGAEGPGPPAS